MKGPDMTVFDAQRAGHGRQCWYQTIELTDDEWAMLDTALADHQYSSATIHRALKAMGAEQVPSPQSVAMHRRGECSCGR